MQSAGPFRGRFMHELRRIWARRETIRYLVSANLKTGHRDKVLGHLWNLLDPLLFMGVYFLVFGVFFRQARGAPGEFLLYLFVGILAWRFLDGTVSQAALCVRGNRGLIHEISFPKAVFPISICFSRMYDYLWGLLVLLIVLIIARNFPTWHVVWVVPLLVLQFAFTLGAGLVIAYLGAFYADTANVVQVGMRLWFYASPIFYQITGPKAIIPEKYLPYYMLNPMACIFQSLRGALIWHTSPDPGVWLYLLVIAAATLGIGLFVFFHGEGKFAKYV